MLSFIVGDGWIIIKKDKDTIGEDTTHNFY